MQALRTGDPAQVGRYELTGRLGEGGQGVVYLGQDPDGRSVAVKLLRVHADDDTAVRERFGRELAVLRRVAGFCTARVLDADIDGDQPYIVSEYVPGPSLQRLVATAGPLDLAALERLAAGTATALAAIHRAGITHRDLKPANVLMGPDGPRVIDFGIARVLAGAATLTSAAVGTPAYMSPEQVEGTRIDTPSDVFAWAATMLFAATGKPPFGNDSIPAVLNRVLHQQPDLSALPASLREIAASCLAKDPQRRPTAQQILLGFLDEVGGTDPSTMLEAGAARAVAPAPEPPPQTRTEPPPLGLPAPTPRRPPVPLILAAALGSVVMLGAVGTVGWWTLAKSGTDKKPPATAALPPDAQAAVTAATADLPALENHDYRTVTSDAARARAVMTTEMQQRYERFVWSLTATVTKQHSVVQTQPLNAGLIFADAGKAGVLVFANSATSTSSGSATTSALAVRMTMVKQGGRWLVDGWNDFTNPLADESLPKANWPDPPSRTLLDDARKCLIAQVETNPASVDAHLAQVERCTTGESLNSWRTSEPTLRQTLTVQKRYTTVKLATIGLTRTQGPDQATVVAYLKSTTSTSDQKDTDRTFRMMLEMKRLNGHWLIAKQNLVT
ncbi:serine/threonine-protein kinase [Actinomadura rupiterrae]|uniref:serine/threonine-protein kinase n=1 Tax=Actinomadura rupiterrae TaxID=559627 RepID=UPI0020A4A8E7|nr:serine/threonine-protein kinase [Actinomadura rupiterrae]MCP2342206.1 putative Ser/Thr protein kinase [Actinomadura rupiterrae]